jgi:hypothetical protein
VRSALRAQRVSGEVSLSDTEFRTWWQFICGADRAPTYGSRGGRRPAATSWRQSLLQMRPMCPRNRTIWTFWTPADVSGVRVRGRGPCELHGSWWFESTRAHWAELGLVTRGQASCVATYCSSEAAARWAPGAAFASTPGQPGCLLSDRDGVGNNQPEPSRRRNARRFRIGRRNHTVAKPATTAAVVAPATTAPNR